MASGPSRHTGLYDWPGVDGWVRVYDDAETAFTVIELFADPRPSPECKRAILADLLFVDPEAVEREVADLDALMAHLAWEVALLDVDGTHAVKDEKRVIDWEADRRYIEPSVFAAYGVPYEELCRRVTLRQLGALVGMAPHETPIGQAVYYRTAKPPKATKHNKEQVKAFNERRRFWRLEGKGEEGASPEMAHWDVFRSLAGAARRAKG